MGAPASLVKRMHLLIFRLARFAALKIDSLLVYKVYYGADSEDATEIGFDDSKFNEKPADL